MNGMFKLVVIKTFEKPGKIYLNIINYSFVLFLIMFLFTLGYNVHKNIEKSINDSLLLNQIMVTKDTINIFDFNDLNDEYIFDNTMIEYNQSHFVKSIDNNKINNINIVHQYSFDNTDNFKNNFIIYGSMLSSYNEIIISKQYVDLIDETSKSILGSSIVISDGNNDFVKTVVGIYDTSKFIVSDQHFIVFNNKIDQEIESVILFVNSINDLQTISSNLEKNHYNVFNYEDDIKLLENISTIVNIGVVFIGLFLIIVASILLSNSTKISILKKYRFLALLKSMGYSHKKLNIFAYFELLFVSLISLFSATILNFIILMILEYYLPFDNIFPYQKISLIKVRILPIIFIHIFIALQIGYSSLSVKQVIRNLDVISLFKESVI